MPSWKTKTYIPERHRKRVQKTKEVNARNFARDLAKTDEYKLSQKLRKRVEHTFAEAKVCHGLGRARCRGLQAMNQQAYMTATVQNIKRLVGYMRRKFRNSGASALAHSSGTRQIRSIMANMRHCVTSLANIPALCLKNDFWVLQNHI